MPHFFRSRVKRQGLPNLEGNVESGLLDCLVFQPTDMIARKAVGLILQSNVEFATHMIKFKGEMVRARLMVKVREQSALVDPFEFRHGTVIFKFV